MDMQAAASSPARGSVEVPVSLERALDPEWLTQALAPVSGGRRVVAVELAEEIRTMASKLRIVLRFAQDPAPHHYCLKAFLDSGQNAGMGGAVTLREADFYQRIAPQLSMRTPPCAAVVIDREACRGLLLMADLVAAGAHFCSALEPFTAEQAAQTLDQIARLHVRGDLLRGQDWIPCRVETIAQRPHFSTARLQALMHDERRGELDARTLDAALLLESMKLLAARNAQRPQTLLHGDCHAGNIYWTAEGPGFADWQLIQRGNWALDVAYHLAAVLPEDVAAGEERRLLDHYLDALRRHGGEAPEREAAWEDYRCAQVYGYYHWAITTRTDPAITNVAFRRLGAGVARHDSYRQLRL